MCYYNPTHCLRSFQARSSSSYSRRTRSRPCRCRQRLRWRSGCNRIPPIVTCPYGRYGCDTFYSPTRYRTSNRVGPDVIWITPCRRYHPRPRIRCGRQLPSKRVTIELYVVARVCIEGVKETVVHHDGVIRGGDVAVDVAVIVGNVVVGFRTASKHSFLGDHPGGLIKEVTCRSTIRPCMMKRRSKMQPTVLVLVPTATVFSR